jgi:hypothetical protein
MILRCDCQIVALVPSNSSTESVSAYVLRLHWVFLKGIKFIHQGGVGVRLAIGEEHEIFIVFEVIGEGKSVEVTAATHFILLEAVLKVGNVLALTVPTCTFEFVELL